MAVADIDPDNIIVNSSQEDYSAQIIDFSFATYRSGISDTMSRLRTGPHSRYWAPEACFTFLSFWFFSHNWSCLLRCILALPSTRQILESDPASCSEKVDVYAFGMLLSDMWRGSISRDRSQPRSQPRTSSIGDSGEYGIEALIEECCDPDPSKVRSADCAIYEQPRCALHINTCMYMHGLSEQRPSMSQVHDSFKPSRMPRKKGSPPSCPGVLSWDNYPNSERRVDDRSGTNADDSRIVNARGGIVSRV